MLINDPLSTVNQHDVLTEVRVTSSSDESLSTLHDQSDAIVFPYRVRRRYSRRPAVSIDQTMHDMGRRLTIGKFLQHRLAIVSDVMCVLAIASIFFMILANELTFNRTDESNTKASWFIKLLNTLITATLLVLLIYYHYLDLKLYSNQNALYHDLVGLTYKKMLWILMELLVCVIHPFPTTFPSIDPPKLDSIIEVTPYPLSYIARDVGLGLPMFLRLYLFGRSLLFHSQLIRNASLRSFSYLNRVSMDLFFLIKTALQHWPGRCLLTVCLTLFFLGSWCLRACVYQPNNHHLSMPNAMWLFIVTFATIGYGDIVPSSYCGRAIVGLVGLGGILITALLIAVLAQKLLLTRSEKYVHTFVLNTELANKRYGYAANVIKYAVLAWYLRRKYGVDSFRHLRAQRKLFHSISCSQHTKKAQKILADNCVGLHELMSLQQNINTQYETSIDRMYTMRTKMDGIETRLNHLATNFNSLMNSMNLLLNTIETTSTD